MNKRLLYAALLLIPFNAFSQITIKGFVRYYPKQDSIATYIGIKHENPKTIPTATDGDGMFSLKIDPKTKSPTRISIDYDYNADKYKNFIIVNEYTTDNISTSNKDTVKIYVANRKTINEQRIRFYEMNAERIDRKYDEEINLLRISNQNKQNIIDSLNKERAADKAIIRQLSQRNAELEIENYELRNDPNLVYNALENIHLNAYNTALNFFLNGQNEEALKSKLTIDLLRRHAEVNELVVKRAKLNVLIYTAMGDYLSAIEWYNNIIRYAAFTIDNTDKEAFLIYMDKAELEFRLRQDSIAENDVREAMDKKVNDIYKIRCYNLLGKIQQDYKNYKQAIKLYKEIKKEHDNAIIEIADKDAAISYTLLGDYYKQIEKNEPAKTNYHKALDIYTELNGIGEIEVNAQCVVLLKLAAIYNNEKKESMVNKFLNRISLLEEIDRKSIDQDPDINLRRAIYNMQNGNFSKADKLYARVLEHYKKDPNQKQELIVTMFLSGLNQFYAKSYDKAHVFFSQTLDSLSTKDFSLLGKNDSVCLKALCMAAIGIIKKEQGNKINGLFEYNEARNMIVKYKNLENNEKKILLKYITHLKKYSKQTKLGFIECINIVGGFAVFLLPMIF